MAGIRRKFGTRPDKVDPQPTAQLAQLIATLDLATLGGLRDRALLPNPPIVPTPPYERR